MGARIFVAATLIVSLSGIASLSGCIHKPEGPAERIGRSIDEISSAIDDMSRDDETQRDRIRRERERRERETAARRDRFDRDESDSGRFDRGDRSDDDEFADPYGDRGEQLPPLPEDEFRSPEPAELPPFDVPYGGRSGGRERY
jgi:hypothetical protein